MLVVVVVEASQRVVTVQGLIVGDGSVSNDTLCQDCETGSIVLLDFLSVKNS